MKRLSLLDALFLYLETPETPMHAGSVTIFKPESSGDDLFARFRAHAAARLDLLPPGDAQLNNQVVFTLSRLPTDVAEPLPRLAAAQAAGQEAKNLFADIRGLLTTDISILGAPLVVTGLARLWGHTRASNYLGPFFNVVISNVPGHGVIAEDRRQRGLRSARYNSNAETRHDPTRCLCRPRCLAGNNLYLRGGQHRRHSLARQLPNRSCRHCRRASPPCTQSKTYWP